MNNYDITILETWDKEIIEIETDIQNWLQIKSEAKSKGEDGIFLKDMQRFIKFSNIKDEKGKTLYISLPAPKTQRKDIKDMTPQERKDRKELLDRIWEETKEGRKKKFIASRVDILKRLAIDEERHELETTKNKLYELECFRKEKLQEMIK